MSNRWMTEHGNVDLTVAYAYRGASRCNADSQLQGSCQVSPNFSTGDAQQRTDIRLDWSSPDERWGAAVYGSNVFDQRYVTGVGNVTTPVFGTPYASVTPPGVWGVELRASF